MACAFGQLASPTGTGNISVTGLSFQPVAVMLFSTQSSGTQADQYFGAASSSSEQWCIWTGIRQETSGYTERHRELRNDHCAWLYDQTNHATLRYSATLVSLNSDGFTLNVDTFNAGGASIDYMAIGGDHIADAKAGTFTASGTLGTVSVTGVGFKPCAIVFANVFLTDVNTIAGIAAWGIGFTDRDLNQYSVSAVADQGSATAGTHIHRTDAISCGFFSGNSYVIEMDSMDDDGFTVDVVDTGGNVLHGYLAIDAEAASVGSAEIPDSTGVQTYSTPGLQPGGVLFTWNGADTPSTTGSTTMPVRPGFGAMDSASEGSITFIHRASAPFGAYQPAQEFPGSPVYIKNQGSQTDANGFDVLSESAFSAFNEDEFALNWTTASTNSRVFGWLALPGELPVLDMSRRYGHP